MFFIACAILVSSCATGSFVSTTPKAKNDTSTKTIQCYYSTEKPDRAYEVIGHVEASGFVFASNKQLVYALQKQAQKQQAKQSCYSILIHKTSGFCLKLRSYYPGFRKQ